VLMLPGASPHGSTEDQIQQWGKAMRAAGIQLGSVDLQLTRGVLRNHQPVFQPGQPTFSEVIRDRLSPRPATAAAAPISPAPAPEAALGKTVIAFQVLRQFFRSPSTGDRELTLDDPCFLPRLTSCGFHTVIVGAGYSADDEFLTPVGALNGVDVHAAIAACPVLTEAQARVRHFRAFAVEVAIGAFILAPVMVYFWGQYFRTRWHRPAAHRLGSQALAAPAGQLLTTRASPSQVRRVFRRLLRTVTPAQPASAYGWLLYMAAVLVVLMGVAMLVLPLGSNGCSVATLPAALVVGLLLEVAMVQGVLVASSEGSTFNAHEPPRWPGDYRPLFKPKAAVLPTLVRFLAYDAVLLFALHKLFFHGG
jgi:hypothetical protein